MLGVGGAGSLGFFLRLGRPRLPCELPPLPLPVVPAPTAALLPLPGPPHVPLFRPRDGFFFFLGFLESELLVPLERERSEMRAR